MKNDNSLVVGGGGVHILHKSLKMSVGLRGVTLAPLLLHIGSATGASATCSEGRTQESETMGCLYAYVTLLI